MIVALVRRLLLLAFALFITLPLVMVLLEAFGSDWFGTAMLPAHWTLRWFVWAAQTVDLVGVMLNTVEIAALATVLTLAIALPAAWALARYRPQLKSILIGAILFPRMNPEITFALGVARIFYAINLTNTVVGIAMAHVILAAPFAVVVLVISFGGMDPRLLEAGAVQPGSFASVIERGAARPGLGGSSFSCSSTSTVNAGQAAAFLCETRLTALGARRRERSLCRSGRRGRFHRSPLSFRCQEPRRDHAALQNVPVCRHQRWDVAAFAHCPPRRSNISFSSSHPKATSPPRLIPAPNSPSVSMWV